MDQITLKNFRCFRDEQSARLAPLTLLVGENSTGKTSFMAMIRALRDVVGSDRAPNFKEEPYDLGSFDEIAHYRGGRGGRAEAFEAGFKVAHGINGRTEGRASLNSQSFDFKVTFKKRGTVPSIEKARISNEQVWIEDGVEDRSWATKLGTRNGVWKFPDAMPNRFGTDFDRMLPPLFYPLQLIRRGVSESEPKLIALENSEPPNDRDWKLAVRLVENYRSAVIRHYRHRAYAGAPVRSKPRRTYDPAPDTFDPEGKHVPMLLANWYFHKPGKWAEMKSALEAFGSAAGLYDEISIRPLGKKDTEPFQMRLRKFGDRAKGPWRNLIDVGYGVSQVLPVVTDLYRNPETPIFLIQQPEVHLHPSAQAALGSLLCQVAGFRKTLSRRPKSSTRRKLLVETHSDHLLDRVRMEVRDGKSRLKPEDVSILFFERGNLAVKIHSLKIDGAGNILNAPASYRRFFMEETTRSLGL